jgi:hypothetical protein
MKSHYNFLNDNAAMRSWDEFYHENYKWALKCISHHEPDFFRAMKILDKIFLNLTLDAVDEYKDPSKMKSSLSIKLAGVISRINREKRKQFMDNKVLHYSK